MIRFIDPLGCGRAYPPRMTHHLAFKIDLPPLLLRLGILLYAVSFALPAVAVRSYGKPIYGWTCALIALHPPGPNNLNPVLFLSGLANIFALACVGLRIPGVHPDLRRVLAIVALCGIPCSWFVIAQDLSPRIGHILWVAGLCLMLLPEAIG